MNWEFGLRRRGAGWVKLDDFELESVLLLRRQGMVMLRDLW
jgi:hypothetical protein